MKRWKKINSQTVFSHPRITLLEDTIELPSGERVPYLRFERRNDSVVVICIKDDQVLLQKEYSYPPNEVLYQFPGGKVEPSEGIAAAAKRELVEEAGLKAVTLTELGWFYVDNRRTDAKMYVFLATDCTETQKQGGDLEEDITSHWTPIERIDAMIKTGKIVNYSLLAAWSFFKIDR